MIILSVLIGLNCFCLFIMNKATKNAEGNRQKIGYIIIGSLIMVIMMLIGSIINEILK